MKKVYIRWKPVYGMEAIEPAEMGTRSEVSAIYKSFPSDVRSYEGTGFYKKSVVHVVSVPDNNGGTRLLVYPKEV